MSRYRTAGVMLLLLAGCADATTQVVVNVDSARCDINAFRVMVAEEIITFSLDDVDRPVSIAVSGSGSFLLTVEGLSASGVVVSRSQGTVPFTEGEILGLNVSVGPECTPAAPCTLAAPTRDFTIEPAPLARECADVVESYTMSPSAFDVFIDACSAGAPLSNEAPLLVNADSGEARAVFPAGVLEDFDFRFYGRLVQNIWLSTDGVMSFSRDAPGAAETVAAVPLDQTMAPRPSVMGFWDNLRTRSLGICWIMSGNSPNRTFTATWSGVCTSNCDPADNMNFSISLEEGTDRVVITYGTMVAANASRAQGQFASVGIVSTAPAQCAPNQCSAAGLCEDGAPCGYTQVFAQEVQASGLSSYQFVPNPR